MGLLTLGSPLSWDDTRPHVDYVKEHGLEQFVNIYHRLKTRQGDCLKWGDEIEYLIVKFDEEHRKVRLSLRGTEICSKLQESEDLEDDSKNAFLWRPEYASYMVEGTPGTPYGGMIACFNVVEDNMRRRRAEVAKLLEEKERVMTVVNFPSLGCPDFTYPHFDPTPGVVEAVSRSLFFPDEGINNSHPRFANLTRNIRGRRGQKVAINVPIFRDENTPNPFVEDFQPYGDDGEAREAGKPDHIYMDAMGFGMGCCCLQVTFQAQNVSEARWLYDQLTPVTPILLALSAATPIFRGYLADVDSRWNIIAASVDDRTDEERGLKPLKEQRFVMGKSRYDTTDCYIYPCSSGYNDIPLQYEQKHLDALVKGGIDPLLAQHIAHLFIRDPLQVYRERIEQDDTKSSEHFETIQSSNWMNMRFKPPPADSDKIGWRVEFRPTEVQLTDFENAAYVCFVVLLTRVIISFRLTFLIPISQVNENMERAQKRDAVLEQKFYFRRGLATCHTPPESKRVFCDMTPSDDVEEMTVEEIMSGKGEFPGLSRLIRQYLDSADVDVDTRCTISQYLSFIEKRASGQIQTAARWIRDFVAHHPEYRGDSRVGDGVVYDLLRTMDDLAEGRCHCPKLLGDFRSKTNDTIPEAIRLESRGRPQTVPQ